MAQQTESVTGRELVDQYRTWLGDKSGKIKVDNSWSPRAILFSLLQFRNQVIRAELQTNPNTYRYMRQTIPCIPLETVDHNECPCAPATGCTWLRTKYPIPHPIGKLISVTGIATKPNDFIKYDYIQWEWIEKRLQSWLKPERERPYYCIRNGYIYLHNDDHKKALSVTGVFANPIDVFTFPDCEGKVDGCTPHLDYPFLIDPTTQSTIFNLAAQSMIGYQQSVGNFDIINNERGDQGIGNVPLK